MISSTPCKSLHVTDDTFILGLCRFKLASKDPVLLQESGRLFQTSIDQACDVVFNLDLAGGPDNPITALTSVISSAFRSHNGRLYIDACVLWTPEGQTVLLAGASHAGKTTLTVAMAKAFGWKIICEDLAIIDCKNDRLIPVTCPLSLRSDAPSMLATELGIRLPELYLDKWLLDRSMFVDQATANRFDFVVLLTQQHSPGNVSPEECLRLLLPLSNAHEIESGIEILFRWIKTKNCFTVGGMLKDRSATLAAMVG